MDEAKLFDMCALVAVMYNLSVLGLRTKFYRVSAEDPTYAKFILPTLERRGELAASDDLDSLATLESHLTTQLMRAFPPPKKNAINASKHTTGGSASTDLVKWLFGALFGDIFNAGYKCAAIWVRRNLFAGSSTLRCTRNPSIYLYVDQM